MQSLVSDSVTDVRNPLPSPNQQRMPHLKALTSVRAIAALYVGLFHMVRPFRLWGPLAGFVGAGYTGVSFFFMLSGFILVYTHGLEYSEGRGSAKNFWMARFARVYPLYALSLIVIGIIGRAQFFPRYHLIAYVMDYLMLQSWSIRMVAFFSVVAWSVSAEAFFYFVFPFVAARLRPQTTRRGVWMFLGCWALALLPSVVAFAWDPAAAWLEDPPKTQSHNLVWALVRYPILLVPQFLCGVVLGWIYLQRPISKAFGQLAVYAGFGGAFALLMCADHLPFVMLHDGLLLPLFALMMLGLCRPNLITSLLTLRGFVLMGEASYAFYLFHFMFNDYVMDHYHWPPNLLWQLPRFLILIPFSVALHLLVERPCRRAILGWWKQRQAVQTA